MDLSRRIAQLVEWPYIPFAGRVRALHRGGGRYVKVKLTYVAWYIFKRQVVFRTPELYRIHLLSCPQTSRIESEYKLLPNR